MRKLFLLWVLPALSFVAYSQDNYPHAKTASTPTLVTDVLHYYFNKQYYKEGQSAAYTGTAYPYYVADATIITYTSITYCGSIFEVPAGETVTVTGVEAFVAKDGDVINLTIPIRMYVCDLNASGFPIMPPIDSIEVSVGGSGNPPPPQFIGADFIKPNTLIARTFSGPGRFGVMMKNVSGQSGDLAHFLHTSAVPTSTDPAKKYGDGYSFVRYQGQFYSTKNFSLAPGFGVGTDYEFMIAPRVSYELQAGHMVPPGVIPAGDAGVPTVFCNRTVYTFTNTSDEFYVHRQYNLNELWRKYKIYSVNNADSAITWDFEFYFNLRPDSREFLPPHTNTISAVSGLSNYPDCFTANQFRARLKPMAATGAASQLVYTEDFTICTKWCNGDALSVETWPGIDNLRVFPNPAIHGKTLITELEGKNTIAVYDLLGQLISKDIVESKTIEIDLSKQPKGTYMVRIINADNRSRAIRIMTQD